MQLLEIELTNWGPFYGEHVIPLSVSEASPVVVFRGENMRGKTSLLRAIIWCLYGEIKSQDGRTPIPVSKLVNMDALSEGATTFGVRLRMSHNGSELNLHRSGEAEENSANRIIVSRPSTTLIPNDGHPYPESAIPEAISGILNRDISEFFLFDGEMLNRFEERLREEKSASQGFVRSQVERALGLPFLRMFADDLDAIQTEISASMDVALRKSKKHETLSSDFRAKTAEFEAKDRDRLQLRALDEKLAIEIQELETQMAGVEEIKELYYERQGLEREIAVSEDTVLDYTNALAEHAEANWWLPLVPRLSGQINETDRLLGKALSDYETRIKLQFRLDQLFHQVDSGVCATCGQAVTPHDSESVEAEMRDLEGKLMSFPTASVDEVRGRSQRLQRYSNGPALVERVLEQEQDLRREQIRDDKRKQKVRHISELLSGNSLDIASLEANLVSKKSLKSRSKSTLLELESNRTKLKQELAVLSGKMADQPEVDENERRLQKLVVEATRTVAASFSGFRSAMRHQVQEATSKLFLRLTTEKDYSGVKISDDYLLSVVDDQQRSLSMISAGANQILTMAFIGALAECSIEEAPMVMDTPFGRLDVGHRSGILDWVSTFDTQVILFVQSGEYDVERDAHLLSGKIGREFTIERLTPTRSLVVSA